MKKTEENTKQNTEEHLAGLNEKQREAALHREGPLLIVAGAGAGKTKTITHRIVNLIKNGVAPDRILAVTFTNKAAREMRDRITAEIEKTWMSKTVFDNRRPFVSTFHSLGVHIIKENARALGLNRHFSILDEDDTLALVKEALKELEFDPKEHEPRRICTVISREKGNFVDAGEYAERVSASGGNPASRVAAQVWPLYEKKKAKENSLDFDDLLLKTAKLLKENEKVKKIYQRRWRYIHIDEYQDTNEVQYLISRLLTGSEKNICVVGDADQNIYSWRGANLKNILSFEKDYPEAKIILLEENYRSTGNILDAANVVIKKNKFRPEKNLFTKKEAGEKIALYAALDEVDEADFVAMKILEIEGKTESEQSFVRSSVLWGPTPQPDHSKTFSNSVLERGVVSLGRGVSQADGPRGSAPRARGDSDPEQVMTAPLSEVAVLYRANFQSRALEEAMLRHNIPYQVLGVKFFERKEIKDTLAYLRAALNPESLSDIKRIINFPPRGIGKATLAKLFAGDTKSLPEKMRGKIKSFYKLLEAIGEKIKTEKASEVIKFTVRASGLEKELSEGTEEEQERLENIKELATLALKYDPQGNSLGVEKLLEDAVLASEQDGLMINGANPVRGPRPLSPERSDGGRGEGPQRPSASNGVKLMTVHAAKGLEFKYVFVAGLEDGLFPHSRMGEGAYAHGFGDPKEEERRLFYVAITRAKEKLFLSFAGARTIFGSRGWNMPSEFIFDIPENLVEIKQEKTKIIEI